MSDDYQFHQIQQKTPCGAFFLRIQIALPLEPEHAGGYKHYAILAEKVRTPNASFEEFPISGVPPSATVERLLEQIPWKIRSHIAEGRETTER